MRDFLSKRVVSLEPSGIRKFFDIVSEMPDAISLGVGEPDFDTPWRVREEGIYSLERGRTFYTSNAGLKELRYEISEYLERKYELVYDPNHEITVTVGGSEGIDIAMRTILDPGDEVIVVQPCFVSYVACVVMAGGTPVIVSLKEEDKFKLKKEQLEAAVTDKTKAMIISFPNNPTGAIMTREELEPIAEFAKEHGFTAQSLNEKYADILKDITSHSKDAVQSTVADKGLQKLINTVKDLDSSEYTADSWKALEDAVAAAKDVVAKADASQSEIDAAVNGIIEALGNLEYGVQTLHLETAIEAAEAILADPDNYVSVDALKAAVEAGKAVLANKEATQAEIDAAANAVLAELSALAENADRASLKKLADAAEKLTDGNYTSDSIAKLNDAISKAKDALENGDEAAIAGAYEELIDAITNLEMKGNKAALKAMLEKAAAILADTDAYVASTIDGLATVKADAQNVYDNADAVQSEINAAVKSLTLKIAAARLLGDVNGDGAVTTSDSVSVLAASAELTSLDADATASADVNGDGVADTLDAALILQTAAEK